LFSGSRPDVIAADAELLEGNGILVLDSQLHGLQVRVHRHVNTWLARSGFRVERLGFRVFMMLRVCVCKRAAYPHML
jgi:hypothetical protein